MSNNETGKTPDMDAAYGQGALAADGPLTGAVADEMDQQAESIIPPEQAPMDDAVGGPQVDPDAPFEMPGEGPSDGGEPQVPTESNDASADSEAQPS